MTSILADTVIAVSRNSSLSSAQIIDCVDSYGYKTTVCMVYFAVVVDGICSN